MKIQNKALIDLDGQPLRDQMSAAEPPKADAPILYVAKVLERAAMSPPTDGKAFTAKENADRYDAAVYLHQVELCVPFELADDLVASLKLVITRSYAPLVAGQVINILEGK